MSLSATLFGRDSAIFKATNILGLGIPGWLDRKFGAKDTEGPRLSDLSIQTSTFGAPIPRYYGMCAGAGNVINLEGGKLKEKVKKKKSGGKGGSSSEPTRTYTYSATFQLALCEGPIVGVRRIWCGDILIYNSGSDDLNSIIASNQAAKGWKLYLGTDDQMPDPRYEAEHGVGNVSAHRGLAYIAFYDFQLEKYSNTLQAAQFKVEIVTKYEAGSVRTLLNKTMFTSTGSTAPGFFIDGSISDVEGDGAYAIDGIATGASTYVCRTSGATIYNKYFGAQATYTFAGLKGCDDHDFAWWQGPLVTGTPFVTKDGYLYAGTINQDNASLIKRDGSFYYFEHDTTIARKCSRLLGSEFGYTIAASRLHAVYGAFAYGLSPDMSTLYEWDLDDFSLVSSKAVTNSALLSSGGAGVYSLRYCDGLSLYISSPYGGGERIILLDISSGDASIYMDAPARPGTSQKGAIRIFGDLYYRLYYGDVVTNDAVFRVYQRNTFSTVSEQLSFIISNELKSSGLLTDDDFDTSLISATVRGYRVAGGSIREALEPLQTAFPFDVVQSGYKIKFIPRGQSSVATIPWEQLGATGGGDDPKEILKQTREMDSQLPAKTTVTYLDAAREYNINEQQKERINTQAVNVEKIELPIVLTADEAAGIAEVQEFLPWTQRTSQEFVLPPAYLNLEASDVITIVAPDATYEVMLTDVAYTQDGRLECKSVPDSAAIYTPNASGAEGVPPDGTIGLAGPALFIPLDIPVVDESVQSALGFVGSMSGDDSSWPGGTVFRTPDDGQTWVDLQGYTGPSTLGTVVNALSVNTCTLIDQSSISVSMLSGELESITRDQMISGMNYAAYGVDGRWEIVRFQNASLQTNGTYLVSGFVRGDKGTEWATGLHQSGDYFVVLADPDNAFISMAGELVGTSLTYRGITSGRDLTTGTDVPFTYNGVNLKCLSPVNAVGARASGDLTATWVRRSRQSGNWWVTGVPTAVGEASEAYEVDVMSGSTVKRTITSTSPTITYTSAQQVTDFGSAQSSITLRIYQLSGVVGRGYPLEVTL